MKDVASKEYYFLQSEVGRYDQLSHSIKNWSITAGFLLIAAGFAQKTSILFLVASFATLLFWVTDARWKRYQILHGKRLREIESFLIDEIKDYSGPRITSSIREQFSDYGNNWFSKQMGVMRHEMRTMWITNVRQPHLYVFCMGVLLFLISKYPDLLWDSLPPKS